MTGRWRAASPTEGIRDRIRRLRGARGLASDDDLHAILNGIPAMVGYWDRNLRNRMADDAYVGYFGLTPEQIRGMHIRDVLGPDLFAMNHPNMLRALAGEEQTFDREIPDPHGRRRYTQASYIPHRIGGEVRGFFVLVTDISARREAERKLASAERRFRTLFEAAPIGTFLVSPEGRITDANAAAVDLMGRSREELVGTPTAELTHPEDREASRRNRERLVSGEISSYRIEKRYVRGDGTIFWAQLDSCLLRGESGEEDDFLLLGEVQDITARRARQAELERQANQDPLTGLLNRRAWEEALEREIERTDRYGGSASVLLLDLDRFKEVNDVHGHQAGDEVLEVVATLLRRRLRESDTIARYGGDEFAAMLPETDAHRVAAVSRDIEDAIRSAHLGRSQAPITASVGATAVERGDDPAEVMARADAAMYRAKELAKAASEVAR